MTELAFISPENIFIEKATLHSHIALGTESWK